MRNLTGICALKFLETYFVLQYEVTNNSCYLNDVKSMETSENTSVVKNSHFI